MNSKITCKTTNVRKKPRALSRLCEGSLLQSKLRPGGRAFKDRESATEVGSGLTHKCQRMAAHKYGKMGCVASPGVRTFLWP